ncbi:MAG TPA: MMPL family transporter [Patescibacteria group bacterium]|jgi:uncharacterized membrane protein YdfJ with MMPL/SSD domain|nr:MMPL family transporter [Patescibacteria group bacterium]
MFTKLGNLINRHSGKVLISSIIFIIFAGWYGFGVFPKLSKGDLADRNSESSSVVSDVRANFSKGVAGVVVLFRAHDGQTVDSPEFKQEVNRLLDKVKPDITSAASYYSTGSKQFVSSDLKSTYAALVVPGTENQQVDKVAVLREALKSNVLDVSVGGQAAVNADVSKQINKDLSKAEAVSFSFLAILLVIVFRSAIAALLPLFLGGFAIVGAFFVTRLLTNFTTISQYSINIITLLGLGLAIDYSLFMVSRFREELHASRDASQAIKRTMETAGHTVFFSGLTVIASLLCLQVFPVDFLRSMSWGGAAAVFVALIAAMLVLPAILRLLGIRIDALSFGNARRNARAFKEGHTLKEQQSIWYKTGKLVMRFRWVSIVVSIFILLAAGLPFLSAHFSTPDYRGLPSGSESRLVSEKLMSDFNDTGAPIRMLYTTPDSITKPAQIAALYDFVQNIHRLPHVTGTSSIIDLHGAVSVRQYQAIYAMPNLRTQEELSQRVNGNTTLIDVKYKGNLDAPEIQQLVEQLRSLPTPSGVQVKTGGGPAILHDLLATLKHYIPYGLLALGTALFLLLFLLSRSFIIPLQAIVLSILSLGAAFGALVWVFQDGHWANVFDLTPTGSIDATMPVLIFAIAFGLSVDYSVFLYSRIKEQYDSNGGDNKDAVLTGLQKTGSIITSAAALLFVVVSAFATGRIPLMQQIGVGLALTVLIDAFIIRMVLVPALMSILGRANWWAPKIFRR